MANNDPKKPDADATPTGPTAIRDAVEAANAADESASDDDGDQDSDDDDSGDDADHGSDAGGDAPDADASDDDADSDDSGADDEDEPKPGDKPATSHRFTQFEGPNKTDGEYLTKLEKGYEESSAEAIRLNQQLTETTGRVDNILKAVASDPELATKLDAALKGGTPSSGSDAGDAPADGDNALTNPFVQDMQAKWEKQSTKEIEEFIGANPEVASDPKIAADVKHWMGVFSREHQRKEGTLMSGGQAMAAAYKHLGLENKLEKQELANGAKGIAAPTRPHGSKKKSSGQNKSFTPEQIAMAQAMGKDVAYLEANAK